MPADLPAIPALIAEGRRLIAEATADRVLPLKKTVCEGYSTLIEADGTPLARTDGDGSAYVEDYAVDVVAFAVAHLPALLDVAEAAAALRHKMREVYADSRYMNVWATAQERLGPYSGPDWIAESAALDAALEKLNTEARS